MTSVYVNGPPNASVTVAPNETALAVGGAPVDVDVAAAENDAVGVAGNQVSVRIGSDVFELFDSLLPPDNPPNPYLRFERDIDGDVQAIYLGTAD